MPVENSKESPALPDMKELSAAFQGKQRKTWIVMLVIGIIALVGGTACGIASFLIPKATLPDLEFPKIPSEKPEENNVYSNLTGEILASEADKAAPAYCIQTPNGLDGARPQAGLNQAGVVFEAIAEAGITRFAAIYQNPSSAVIGPIRSLRLYYLKWDTPFDCTIVHAGGADDALAAVRAGGYKDLTENYTYMYRGTVGSRRWNNLFTTSAYLAQMNSDRGYGGSNIAGFTRMTPDEAYRDLVDHGVANKLVITEPTEGNTSTITPSVAAVNFRFGNVPSFNVHYDYNAETNSYNRSYATGAPHEIYECPNENLGEVNPENPCTLKVLSPKVIIAMIVQERRASDNYHEDITAIGSGDAYVFQNGQAYKGKWNKPSDKDQIKFADENGAEIRLVPGQTFISAIPTYGGVEY